MTDLKRIFQIVAPILVIPAAVGGLVALQRAANRSYEAESFEINDWAARHVTRFDRNDDDMLEHDFEMLRPHPEGYTWSIRDLAQAADARGNRDAATGADEIATIMRDSDTGDGTKHPAGDGRLGGAEKAAFTKAYGPWSDGFHGREPRWRDQPLQRPGTT